MSLFDGQVAAESLSDEALFGVTEGQEEAPPQTEEAEVESPAIEQTSEEAEVESAAPETGQAAEELEAVRGQYREAHATLTKLFTERAEQNRQIETLRAQVEKLQVTQSPEAKKERLQMLVETPDKFLQENFDPMLERMLEEKLAPLRQEAQMREDASTLQNCIAKIAQNFTDAKEPEKQKALVARVIEIGNERYGDRFMWRKDPQGFFTQAAFELWGVPKVVDQAALNAAAEQARQSAVSQRQAQDADKARLNAQTTKNNTHTEQPTDSDDDIRNAIINAGGGKLFRF